MGKYIKQSEFKRNYNTLVEGIKIGIKNAIEYKVNIYFSIALRIVIFSIFSSIYILFEELIFSHLNWTIQDFQLALLLILFFDHIFFLFFIEKLNTLLLSGDLNSILNKPTNPFILVNYKLINGQDFVTPLFLFPFIIYFILNYSFNILLFLILIIIIIFFNLIFVQFIGSFAFFSKEFPRLLFGVDKEIKRTIRNFTPKVFDFSSFGFIVYLLPTSLMGFGLVEFLLGRYYILSYFIISFIISIVLCVITILMWRYGLKRYEAFG